MRYVEAPLRYDGPGPSLFLAGGVSGCPDWPGPTVGGAWPGLPVFSGLTETVARAKSEAMSGVHHG